MQNIKNNKTLTLSILGKCLYIGLIIIYIYNDTSNFAKLHRVLISIDGNLNFIINFMSAR